MKNRSTARKLKLIHTIFALERDLIVGGQAVMEGVMMRTPSAYAIACRRSDGSIVSTAESLPKWSDKYKWLSWPVLRGGATLIQSLALGVKALNFSARVYEEDVKAQEELEKAKAGEPEAVLVEGTTDENFLKAPVKVIMPEKTEEPAKTMGQSAAAVGSATSVTAPASRPACTAAWRSRSCLYGPQLAGCVKTTASGDSPSTSRTLSWTRPRRAMLPGSERIGGAARERCPLRQPAIWATVTISVATSAA